MVSRKRLSKICFALMKAQDECYFELDQFDTDQISVDDDQSYVDLIKDIVGVTASFVEKINTYRI